MSKRYELFGLLIESAIELPELAVSVREGAADIAIRLGEVVDAEGLVGECCYVHRKGRDRICAGSPD